MAHERSSPFYPPRARWYSPVFGMLAAVRRIFALDRLNMRLAAEVNLLELIACFLVPALGFYIRLPRLIGLALVAWASLLVLAFFVFLGLWEDNFIFSMLLSVHVSGFVFYCRPLLGPSVWRQLGFTLGMTLAIYLLVYLPAQSLLQSYVVAPYQVRDRMVVVRQFYATKDIRAGDWMAYTIDGTSNYGGVYLERGTDVVQVLAIPGDRLIFEANTYSVNGVAHPRLPLMPKTGMCVVPEKEWFLWPNLAIEPGRRFNDEAAVSETILHWAFVTENQFVGRPLQRWFWWTQKLS